MGWPEYERDLRDPKRSETYILDCYFHSGRPTVFDKAAPDEEPKLKGLVADRLRRAFKLDVHPLQLVICGSAHLGFSPVPSKLGQPFDARQSDIDIAVVSPELFESWWDELRQAPPPRAIREQIASDLFWGFIDASKLHEVSDYGRRWWKAFGALKTPRAAGIRGRLYRNMWTMETYHRRAIRQGRARLTNPSAYEDDRG